MSVSSRLRPGRAAASRGLRRLLTAILGTAMLLLATAGPASADPAGPTAYQSVVTGLSEPGAPIRAEIYGGDAFLVLTVEAGTEVYVYGYDRDQARAAGRAPELYLWFQPDGTVLMNDRSRAKYQNEARFSVLDSEIPADAVPGAPPAWVEVGDGGTFAWHDHRIHWMSPQLPNQVSPSGGDDQFVYDWAVELQIDGRDVDVLGTLSWTPPGPRPLPIVLALAIALGLLALGARDGILLPALADAVATVTLVAAFLQAAAAPPGAGIGVIQFSLPGAAVLLASGAIAMTVTGRTPGHLAAVAPGIVLVLHGLVNLGALTQPFLPTGLPTEAVRVVVSLALGTGLGLLGIAIREALGGQVSRAALPDLPDLPEMTETS